jgi:hypothetical protein
MARASGRAQERRHRLSAASAERSRRGCCGPRECRMRRFVAVPVSAGLCALAVPAAASAHAATVSPSQLLTAWIRRSGSLLVRRSGRCCSRALSIGCALAARGIMVGGRTRLGSCPVQLCSCSHSCRRSTRLPPSSCSRRTCCSTCWWVISRRRCSLAETRVQRAVEAEAVVSCLGRDARALASPRRLRGSAEASVAPRSGARLNVVGGAACLA